VLFEGAERGDDHPIGERGGLRPATFAVKHEEPLSPSGETFG
jgi:hypothetical protein